MKLIAGLGNPGKKYEKTRHNFGFLTIDYLQKNLGHFPPWSFDKEANTQISKGEIFGQQVLLAKPQTFMNLSGKVVKALASFYKIDLPDVWVVHDDFDLPLGIIRLSRNSSNGGHKGVKSIIEELGSKDFVRFRLGIHQITQTFICKIFNKITSIEKFVLKNFDKGELDLVDQTIKKAGQAIETTLKDGVAQAMNEFN